MPTASRFSAPSALLFTLSLLLLLTSFTPIYGQGDLEQMYMTPPKEIADIVDAPFTPTISVSPDRSHILILTRPGLPGIDEVAQPELRLAGLRINPRANGPSRAWYYNEVAVRALEGGESRPVTGLPANPRFGTVGWSPDGRYAALVLTLSDRLELWLIDIGKATARRLTDLALNDAYPNPYVWVPDSKSLLAATLVSDRGTAPQEPLVPSGPVIQQNLGRVAPARTYQDMLKNEFDERTFEYYATSQLMKITLDGTAKPVGPPALISSYEPSPDAKYILVETTERPFSYTVPSGNFPQTVAVWDMTGKIVHTVANLPLADNVPVAFGSVRTGPRSVSWRPDKDAELFWVEALDGGDAGAEAESRDQLYLLPAPFTGTPTPVLAMDVRFRGAYWASDKLALATGWWWQTRTIKVWQLTPGTPSAEPKQLMAYSWEDRYNVPGTPMTRLDARGGRLLITADDGQTIFLEGDGASPEGDRPFVDAYSLASGETRRLFRSEAPFYEAPEMMTDPEKRILMTRRESTDIPPNYFLRDLNSGALTQITDFPHPNPQFANVQKEQIRYKREDGVDLTGTLYLPAGYDPEKDGPLPMLMWAYPQEFKSADAAGQVTSSPYRFVRVTYWSPMLWLARGYAVLDDPTMPIVGEGEEEPNDSFVKQLVASAQAAVDEVVRRGVADRDRICVGGHSYGAFMTANLLAHSDLYRAGIARSGAYNRTLTPFGFQSEERTLWEAPEVYFEMSPFMHAEKIDEPILLIHGQADNNSGTYPLQSERFYGALKGLGATARLVMLPHEAHGYRARESIMHMLWEMSEWMDTYVKNAAPREMMKTEQQELPVEG